MKTARKFLMLVLCAALLVTATVAGTFAYLTDTDSVTNTFTVGKVAIELDEAPVDETGAATDGDRVKANDYHLLPSQSYDKDPTVHVVADSEDSYIFVKVVNDIAAIEADTNTIAAQIEANGWTALDGVENVYYKEYEKSSTVVDLVVFEEFTIDGEATNEEIAEYADKTIVVTAYAIQKAGFASAAEAWTAGDFE